MNHDFVLKQLTWRYAVKKFDSSKKISATDWQILEESLRLSPSSYGLQPWKFIVVHNKEILKQLTSLSWGQSQVEDCSHYIVFTTKVQLDEEHIDRHVAKTAEIREIDVKNLAGYKRVMVGDLLNGPRSETIFHWAQRQAYIAMGFLMQTAAMMQIDSCPLEGLDPKGYDKVLGLENTGFGTVAAVACGYRHLDDKYQNIKKVRFDKKDIIIHLD
ncbi:MAG: NAD(P)H-dependent oxidoreductase [Bdellovibrionaceae bacterium]|nr:NAD(P)H-dependent oxidoreductase [Pseudobdellovibrionaceae bacterium]